ncbi:5-oxoprolinase subunit PxpB [Christiangramia aquimixticola]|uniref:5-oxoprolinase subunit PxpB n=1 Tax=Christiangramia aquimixticola TaxID=1697558 RepID=UPI003AA908A3
MSNFPKISALGDHGILVRFEEKIESDTLKTVLEFRELIENQNIKGVVEVTNTYNSLLISYDTTIENVYGEILSLFASGGSTNIPKKNNYKIFYLPVCYDMEFGLDLDHISKVKNLYPEEVISLHTAPLYQIYFIGFMPGFLYLGGLDERLHIARKNTPRKLVEKGAVGIGGNQTGIYPKNSPGGWQILGKSPLNFFDKNSVPPSPFSPGDKIIFEAITKEEYFKIEEQISNGNYTLKTEIVDG